VSEKMEVNEYVGKKVKIDLVNGQYYSGKILSAGEDYVKIRDKNDNMVFVNLSHVISIKEVGG
jgi:small nuclear ribonucleoprotein (snRNP)-like protein